MVYSGNLWGACKRCQKVDSELSPPEASAVAHLMQRAQGAPNLNLTCSGGADIGRYEIDIEEGGEVTRITVDELSVPDEAAALFEMFDANAVHWDGSV